MGFGGSSNRIISLDIGSSELKLGEFVFTKGGLETVNLCVEPLSTENVSSEADVSFNIVEAIQRALKKKAITKAPVLMSLSGQSAFLRLVKLPPVKRNRLRQTILFEAQQNVPFPIDEVIWDYQLMGSSELELNVMLVVIKKEIVENMSECVVAAGLDDIEIIDVAPMAISNAVRYNYGDVENCILVVDIGARSTNLVFLEKGQFFSRNLPTVGSGNVITQQIMKEFNLSFKDAEELKFAHGTVAFGGSYEDFSDKVLSKVSKTIRGVMTRLHVEIERSINFYKTQQGGSAPSLILLAGGTSIISRTDEFFKEKLRIDVEYLNPFRNIIVSENISEEEVGACAHVMGAVVGTALRHALPCPLEINLLPQRLVSERAFQKKQSLLIAAAFLFVLLLASWWFFFTKMTGMLADRKLKAESSVSELRQVEERIRPLEIQQDILSKKITTLLTLAQRRTDWLVALDTIYGSLPDGMWIVSLTPHKKANATAPTQQAPQGNDLFEPATTHIMIEGLIFLDKATDKSISDFRDALIKSSLFTEETTIVHLPMPTANDFARQFKMEIALKNPI
jgi:type IV pilus assembly protein PilM